MKTKIAQGWLATMDNQIDPTTGTVKLRANFDNRDGSLFPNQFVNARLLVEEKQGVTLIPTAAVQRNSQATYVYLVKPDSTCHGADHHHRHHGRGRFGSHLRLGPRRSGGDDGRRQAAGRKQGQGSRSPARGVRKGVHEPVTDLYPPAGRHVVADGRQSSWRARWLTNSCRSRRCRRWIIPPFRSSLFIRGPARM